MLLCHSDSVYSQVNWGFDLCFQPGLVHHSLDDLVNPGPNLTLFLVNTDIADNITTVEFVDSHESIL